MLNKKSKLKTLKRYLCFWQKKKKISKIVQEFELENLATDSFGALTPKPKRDLWAIAK
jgi:hypothetical protein